MHRRSFVKHSAVLGSSLLVGDDVFAAFQTDRVINIAMIGCGDRGKGVLSVIKSMPSKFNITTFKYSNLKSD